MTLTLSPRSILLQGGFRHSPKVAKHSFARWFEILTPNPHSTLLQGGFRHSPKARVALFHKVVFKLDTHPKARIASWHCFVSQGCFRDAVQSPRSIVLQGGFSHSPQSPRSTLSQGCFRHSPPKPALHSLTRLFSLLTVQTHVALFYKGDLDTHT